METIASAATPEGVWVLSKPSAKAAKYANGCRIGPVDGKYPTDAICTTEYGEVLLLDASRSRIVRAYPLAGVPPQYLVVTDGAVYCGRQGEGDGSALPDSMVCRIDRKTFGSTVRVYPADVSIVNQPCFYPPKTWTIADGFLDVKALAAGGGAVWARDGSGTWTKLDPTTLMVVARGTSGPPAT
jgi:hypothetical protein